MNKNQRILKDDEFESLRLYEADSPVHKLVSEKIKFVFEKMFQNTDINIDDFYFTVSEDENPNAFFIPADKTLDGKKNIIAVTVGLLDTVDNIEQFAAVIGHEAGHYIWDQLLGGNNTIFQERAADLRSVDLLINAGYNPRNVLYAQQKLQKKLNVNERQLTLDVHGVHSARVNDIEAYLTLKSNEQGSFPEVVGGKDKQWDDFVAKVYKTRKENPYFSYMKKLLVEKFGTDNLQEIENNDLFDVLISELDAGNINNQVRTNDLIGLLKKVQFFLPTDSQRVTDLAYKIIINLESEEEEEKNSSVFTTKVRNDDIYDFLKRSSIKASGVFKEVIDLRKQFIDKLNNFDKENIEDIAKKLKKYGVLNYYRSCFTDFNPDDEILVPQGEKNIGHRFPWGEAQFISETVSYVFNSYFNNDSSYYSSKYDLRYYYIAQEHMHGRFVVQDYGESAFEKNEKSISKEFYHSFLAGKEHFIRDLDILNNIAKLGRGDISLQDFIFKYSDPVYVVMAHSYIDIPELDTFMPDKEYVYFRSLGFDLDHYKKTYQEKLKTELKKIFYDSLAYDYFIKDDNMEKFYKKNSFDIDFHQIDKTKYNTFFSRIFSVLFKISDLSKKENIKNEYINNKNICNNLEYLLGSKSNYKPFYNEDMGKKEEYDSLKEQEEKWRAQEIKKIEYRIAEIESVDIDCIHEKNGFLFNCLNQDLQNNKKESVLLENVLKTLGFAVPNKSEELKVIVDSLINQGLNRFVFVVCADYLRRGYMFDPVDIFLSKSINIKADSTCADIISASFERNFVIESLPLKDKMALYQFFEKHRVFSNKIANKNKWIKIITDEIIKTDSVEYAEWILMRADLRDGSVVQRKSNDLEFAVEREKLIEFYADYRAKELGTDDLSPDFEMRAQRVANEISGGINGDESNKMFSYQVANGLLDKISSKILAQEKVARIFDDAATRKISGKDAEKYDYYGRVVENLIVALGYTPSNAQAGIEFLNEKLSDKSIERFLSKLDDYSKKYSRVSDYLNKQDLTMLHENFWAANLETRAYLMSRLLDAYSGKNKQKSIDLAVDLFFDKNSEYYKDAKLVVNSVYNNLNDYEQKLILAAITAASQRDENNSMTGGETIGRGLKMFFTAKGAAFIKFGQLLSYMSGLDSDIRKELSTMRDQAKIPSRMELINLIKDSVPENEQKNISYVGKILGAGSFFVTVQIKYKGQDAVIALKRPSTNKLTETGMDLINNTIDDLVKHDSKYKPLKNIANQAKMSAKSEIDINADFEKYKNAVKIYESISVETKDGVIWQPDVAKWLAYGTSPNGENAYKIMEMAPGESLISNKMTEQEKHDAALAYVTLELSILLSGQQWDTDRHQGQQNFYNSDFKNFMIGVFDTGAQMDNKPEKFDKMMLGGLLYSLVSGVKSGKSVSDILMEKVKKIDEFSEKKKKDTVYIDGVQRGLTALSDIIEYQKEIKDENGNIIQESRSLTVDDFTDIIGAIYKSGLIDKTVKRSVFAAAVLDGFVKNLRLINLFKRKKENNLIVNYNPIDKQIDLEKQDVSELEKSKRLNEKKQYEHLGIKKGITEKDNSY